MHGGRHARLFPGWRRSWPHSAEPALSTRRQHPEDVSRAEHGGTEFQSRNSRAKRRSQHVPARGARRLSGVAESAAHGQIRGTECDGPDQPRNDSRIQRHGVPVPRDPRAIGNCDLHAEFEHRARRHLRPDTGQPARQRADEPGDQSERRGTGQFPAALSEQRRRACRLLSGEGTQRDAGALLHRRPRRDGTELPVGQPHRRRNPESLRYNSGWICSTRSTRSSSTRATRRSSTTTRLRRRRLRTTSSTPTARSTRRD